MTGDFSPSADLLSGLAASASTAGASSSVAGQPAAASDATVAPALNGPLRAPVVLLPARIAEDIDAGAATRPADPLGRRAAALAADFAAAGWDIAFYGISAEDTDPKDALHHSARGAALSLAAERAGGIPPRLCLLPFDATATHAGAASALIAACAQQSEGGTPPRCLIVAPALWPRASVGDGMHQAGASGDEPSVDIGHWDGDQINQFHQANVTAPLCLARAHHAAWSGFRNASGTCTASELDRYAEEDVSVVVLLDAAGLQRLVGIDAVPYAASQAAMHATVPSVARAFAPGMRVSAVSAPLRDQTLTNATLAQALCYVAQADTITGATLQLGGVSNQTHQSG